MAGHYFEVAQIELFGLGCPVHVRHNAYMHHGKSGNL